MVSKILLCFLFCIQQFFAQSNITESQGKYFLKKTYNKKPLPTWEETKEKLPSPIYEENLVFVNCYWKTWELAFKNIYEPYEGSGFVSQFIDAAFNQNIFLWDTGFMSMFCNYGYGLIPGIESLDNFYCKQHETGEICREIDRRTGIDFKEWINKENKPLFSRWGWDGNNQNEPVIYIDRKIPSPNPKLTLDALNHPILAWAELESYYLTGNKNRLKLIYKPLKMYFIALNKYLLQGNGLYITDWASMDNSPRNKYLKSGGIGIDISSEMVLFAQNLLEIAKILNIKQDNQFYSSFILNVSKKINQLCWDDSSKFYYDLTLKGEKVPVKTIAAYWTLLAQIPDSEKAKYLISHLYNPKHFGVLNPIPTCSKDSEGYDSTGGYWRGSVWAPTNTMVIKGLEKYGYYSLAKEIATKHLILVSKVFENTGTIWENYSPESIEPGKVNGKFVKPDFVGWSGIAPILYFIEYVIGIKANAPNNEIIWNISTNKKVGCKNFRFNGNIVDLIAEVDNNDMKLRVNVNSKNNFKLKILHNNKSYFLFVKKGNNTFKF